MKKFDKYIQEKMIEEKLIKKIDLEYEKQSLDVPRPTGFFDNKCPICHKKVKLERSGYRYIYANISGDF